MRGIELEDLGRVHESPGRGTGEGTADGTGGGTRSAGRDRDASGRIQTTTAAGPLEIVRVVRVRCGRPRVHQHGNAPHPQRRGRPVRVLQVVELRLHDLVDPAGTTICWRRRRTEASLDAPGEPGKKQAKVFVQLEGMSRPAIVRLGGMVTMPVQPEPTYASALKGVDRGTIRLASIDGRPFQISASNGGTPDFVDFDPARDAPRNVYDVRWSIAGMSPMSIPRWWVFTTDRSDCPVPCRVRNENTGSKRDMARFERRWIPRRTSQPGSGRGGGSLSGSWRSTTTTPEVEA